MSLEKMYIVWICAAVLFGIFEAMTVQLVSVWHYCGFGFNAFDYTSLG